MSKIDSVLEKAKEQAATAAETLPTPANDAAPQAPALVSSQPAEALTMDQVSAGSMTNDEWLKVKEFGLVVGTSSKLIDDGIVVSMNMAQNAACFSMNAGNPAKYAKTYDRVNAVGGGLWVDAVRELNAIDPSRKPYRSADLIMTVLETNKDAVEGVVLGHSLSTTGFKPYLKIYNECRDKGLVDRDVKIKITHKPMENKNGNNWGVIEYELLGEA